MRAHVALLGDSIFDNAAYTRGRPDVIGHLRSILPADSTATLLAVDGSTTSEVRDAQVPQLPTDVTHAVVSMGGNDALMDSDALDLPVSSTKEALSLFGDRANVFESRYRGTVEAITKRVPFVAVCTVYDPRLPGVEGSTTRVGLAIFNDVISRVAFANRIPLIDLRQLVVEPADFANELEPSSEGARKIATAIYQVVRAAPAEVGSLVVGKA